MPPLYPKLDVNRFATRNMHEVDVRKANMPVVHSYNVLSNLIDAVDTDVDGVMNIQRTTIYNAIVELGVKTKSNGDLIISSRGQIQNWLIDLRAVFMRGDILKQISEAFWEQFKDDGPFQLMGVETAAIPLLTALVLGAPEGRSRVNACIIRKGRKTYGLGKAIEGVIADMPVVLIDDIINSGKSAEKARVVLEQAGLKLARMFTVIDYQSKAGERWLGEHNIKLSSLFTLSEFGLSLNPTEPLPTQQYRPLWHHGAEGANPFHIVPKSAPVLVGNRIYRGCDAGKMQAFNADTGEVEWEYQTTGAAATKGIWSTPAISDGRLYFGAYNGVAYCLDADTGKEIWTASGGEWIGASPIVVPKHDLVYFGIEYERPWAQGSIVAFDTKTGKKSWGHLVRKLQHGSPAYWEKGDLLVWGTADHDMLGIRAGTGEIVWSFKTQRSVKYAPFIDEERQLVAFASFDKSIYVLDANTGQKLGQWETGEICYTTPLIAGNKLFCGSGDRSLYVIDLDRMELIKKLNLGARIYSSPILMDDRVIFGTNGGRIIEVDIMSLDIVGMLQLPDAVTNAVAVSADMKKIFVSTYMNHLFAFERVG